MITRLACLVAALLIVGCAETPESDKGSDPSQKGEPSPASASVESIVLERSGRLWYRLGADQPPFTQYEGDAPTFCFDLDANVTQLEATFTFDIKQPMWLQLNEPGRSGKVRHVDGTTDLTLSVEDPPEGRWFAYSGPSAAGGATDWRLVLEARGLTVDLRASDEACW